MSDPLTTIAFDNEYLIKFNILDPINFLYYITSVIEHNSLFGLKDNKVSNLLEKSLNFIKDNNSLDIEVKAKIKDTYKKYLSVIDIDNHSLIVNLLGSPEYVNRNIVNYEEQDSCNKESFIFKGTLKISI